MSALRTHSGSLSSGAATVTFAARYGYVMVYNNDTVGMYATTDGSTPGGDDSYLIPAGSSTLIANGTGYWYQGYGAFDGTTTNPGTTVKLTGSSTGAFSVSGAG